jgi:arylsulfatase A-like enzyme/lysophospholipase L1-like esterase
MKWVMVLWLGAFCARGGIVVDTQIHSSYNPETSTFATFDVDNGDVVVLVGSGNNTQVQDSLTTSNITWTATDVSVGGGARTLLYYAEITASGTVALGVDYSTAGHVVFGAHHLSSDAGGSIEFLDSTTAAATTGTDSTMALNFGGPSESGVYFEALSSYNVWATYPDPQDANRVDKFMVAQGTFSEVTGLSNTYTCIDDGSNNRSLVGLAFREESWTGGNRAPEFDSDPVVATPAATNGAYSESLINYASDADDDPMTFWKTTGPAWLQVATNGTLSGTAPATTGINSWTVFVADNNGGTNTATLEIDVAASEFVEVPLTSSNLYVQGAGFVNIDGNGMNFHRFDFTESYPNLNETRAKTASGVKLSFYTRSDTLKLYFNYMPGDENRNSRFGIYQDGTQVDTPYFPKTETSIVITLTSLAAPGELVRHDVVLPNWSNPILSRMEIRNGEVLEAGNPYPPKQWVVLGDSISHGTGQGASYLTYPYISADMMNVELFNMAVGGAKIAPEVADLLQHFDPVEAIWILAGYNDWQGASESTNSIAADYEQLLAAVRAHQPDAQVFCCTLTYTTNIDDPESGVTAEEVRQAVSDVVNARIAAGDTRLHLVQGDDYSDASFLNDPVHFSEPGAAMFAANVVGIMDPIVNPAINAQNGTNILFIAIDDINPVLGCYGDPVAISPNMDSLAAGGVTFLNAHCQWSVCGPSRASLMTGIMPEETGVLGFRKMRGDADDSGKANSVKRPNVVTIPQYFRYNGYRTAAVGKINDYRCVGSMDTNTLKVAEDGGAVDDPPSWGDPVDPNALPADFFSNSAFVNAGNGYDPPGKPVTASAALPDSSFTDGMACDAGITLLQNLATNDAPFFLGVGFKKPHLAFIAPEHYWNMYTNEFSIHPFQDHPLHEVPYTWNYAKELAGYDEFAIEGNSVTNIPEALQKEMIHGYYACVSFIDAQVGRLLDELETQGLHTNTIVVLWGDHGFHLGDHAEWAKHTNLERATRVPFIIRNPFSGQADVKSNTPVGLIDLYPTLCELAGLPIPEQPLAENEAPTDPASGRSLKGQSLAGVVNGTDDSVRTGVVNLFRRSGHYGYAYRTDRYRYTEWVNGAGNVVAARELYDYVLDPMETVNLAGEPGYDALMYSFSVSMREEFEQMKLSAGDIAAAELQGSPVYDTTAGDLSLPGLGISGSEVSWPDATGVTYNLMSRTNLLDLSWTVNQPGLIASPVVIPQAETQEFYQIHVIN